MSASEILFSYPDHLYMTVEVWNVELYREKKSKYFVRCRQDHDD